MTGASYADKAVVDEISHEIKQVKQLTNHQRDRKALSLWRRRYESGHDHFGTTGTAHGPVACPHREVIWLERPHPRYGKARPHFVPREVVAEAHDCFLAAR